jgi:arginine N-succinyltransferase
MMNFGRSFITHFLPQYPIYVDLLPFAAQEVIGKVDADTEAAHSMLLRLGFMMTDEIDVIDGGPKIAAQKKDIRVITHSRTVTIERIKEISANERLDFRAILAPLIFLSEKSIELSEEACRELQVGPRDVVRIFDPKSI